MGARRALAVCALAVAAGLATAPAGAQQDPGFDPICGLQGGCEDEPLPPDPPPTTTTAPPATTTTAPPVEDEEAGTTTTEAVVEDEDADGDDRPSADESPSEEAILIASGLILFLLSGGSVLTGRRPLGRRPPAVPPSVPVVDATGERLVVHDGSYRGGARGDVWWSGRWVPPEEARRLVDEQRTVLDRADRYARETAPAPRADRLLPSEVAARDAVASQREERRARAARYYRAERQVADSLDAADAELSIAGRFERDRQRWEWVGWWADRFIDGLATRVPVIGEHVFKSGYTIAKQTAEGITEDVIADPAAGLRWGRNASQGFRRGLGEAAFDVSSDVVKLGAGKVVGATGVPGRIGDWMEGPPAPRRSPRGREIWRGRGRLKDFEVGPSWTPDDVARHLDGLHSEAGRAVARDAVKDMVEEATVGGVEDKVMDPVKEGLGIKRTGLDPE